MAIPQLNAGTRMLELTAKILRAATTEEAQKIFESVKGSVLQSKLKRKLIESSAGILSPTLTFLQPPIKSPVYRLPNSTKHLIARQNKWQMIAENLAKMDDGILKEYRERRREGREKEKKNKYPF